MRVGRPAREVIADAQASEACIPATRSGATTPGLDDALLWRVTERRTRDEIDRLAEVLAAVG